MDRKKEYKIALVLYTHGLDYDDRIRKEILSIQKIYPNIKFKIFAVEPNNREEEGITSYGVPYRIPYLKSRDKYPSSSHTIYKAWDFFKTVKPSLKGFDAVWCADEQPLFFLLFLYGKNLIWDLHELPGMMMGQPVKRMLFRIAEKRVKVMIHANNPRLDYLKSIGMVKFPAKHFVLRNYPDFNEIDSEYDDTYHQFATWLGDDLCVYIQGINDRTRADIESVSAVLDVEGLKAVVVGKVEPDLKDRIVAKYGEDIVNRRLFFTWRIKQLKTPQYIRKCIMSLVFYKKTSMNNWYCEPNRLFQNIINGNPVVVGSNPPMKELVERYGVGVCAETDGKEKDKIVSAIERVLKNLNEYKSNINKAKDQWLWQSQEETIKTIVETLF